MIARQPDTKTCTKCKRPLPLSAFGRKAPNNPKLRSWCRRCSTLASEKYYVGNQERMEHKQKGDREYAKRVLKPRRREDARTRLTHAQNMIRILRQEGWSVESIAAAARMSQDTLRRWVALESGYIHRDSYQRLAVMFDRTRG